MSVAAARGLGGRPVRGPGETSRGPRDHRGRRERAPREGETRPNKPQAEPAKTRGLECGAEGRHSLQGPWEDHKPRDRFPGARQCDPDQAGPTEGPSTAVAPPRPPRTPPGPPAPMPPVPARRCRRPALQVPGPAGRPQAPAGLQGLSPDFPQRRLELGPSLPRLSSAVCVKGSLSEDTEHAQRAKMCCPRTSVQGLLRTAGREHTSPGVSPAVLAETTPRSYGRYTHANNELWRNTARRLFHDKQPPGESAFLRKVLNGGKYQQTLPTPGKSYMVTVTLRATAHRGRRGSRHQTGGPAGQR